MKVFRDIDPLQKYLSECKCSRQKIGLVPTMGALHAGHLSLLRTSLKENDLTVCSIYVNPTQFNNSSDFQLYPRQEKQDLDFLEETGCDVVFIPSDDLMYQEKPKVIFGFGLLEEVMEGKFRPGHFNGVALVVSKLLHLIDPDHAYFGQKDLQQYLIIRQLVVDLGFSVTLHCVPIERGADGLALSSRNLRLTEAEKKLAANIYRHLIVASERLVAGASPEKICAESAEALDDLGFRTEYFVIADAESLQPLSNVSEGKRVAICVAAYLGDVRLIDNVIVQEVGSHAN